ncbi:MAG: DUF1932 domain-containing protein [Actinomycetota bacterium]|nr:DUF1932 domain-containing protein [Actinomycetota bacterium]
MTTGILHPGAMGASVAAACSGQTAWVSAGRSPATAERAERAGLEAVTSIAELCERAEVIVSVCPPAAAVDVADAVAAAGFDGIYADVNAIAPATARAIGERFERFVDGGIIGPPAWEPGTTRLYLSGDDAAEVATRWEGSPLEVRLVEGGAGAASAVKASYAAWTKGSAALLLAVRALARAEGVEDALVGEWARSQPGLDDRCARVASVNAPKGWRFAGELAEIAAAFEARGLPGGFGLAASEVYGALGPWKDAERDDVDLAAVLDALLDEPAPPPS